MGKASRRKRGFRKPQASPQAEQSRLQMKAIWDRARAGETLDDEEASLVRAIRMHPEYQHVFDQPEVRRDRGFSIDGANPFLHFTNHSIVQNQRQLLPDVEDAIQRLCASGLSEHEAEHRVGVVLSDTLYTILKEQTPFDEAAYLARIRALK
jgi:hypothetical protein